MTGPEGGVIIGFFWGVGKSDINLSFPYGCYNRLGKWFGIIKFLGKQCVFGFFPQECESHKNVGKLICQCVCLLSYVNEISQGKREFKAQNKTFLWHTIILKQLHNLLITKTLGCVHSFANFPLSP